MCAAVSVDQDMVRFETIDDSCPKARMLEALDALEQRTDDALHTLAHQPATPPLSMC